MAAAPPPEQQTRNDDAVNEDFDRMVEDAENISVQFTWMAYDMVALRSGPALGASMRKLTDAHERCRVAVCGDQEPDVEPCVQPAATSSTDM